MDSYAEQMVAIKTQMLTELRTFAVIQLSPEAFEQTWRRYQSEAKPLGAQRNGEVPPLHEMLQDIPFDMWLFFDCADETGVRLIDAFAESGELPGEDELALVQAISHAYLAPYIIEQVERQCWLTLQPLFGGEPVRLFDRYMARMAQSGQAVVTRLYEFDGRTQMIGFATMLGAQLIPVLRERLEAAHDAWAVEQGSDRDWPSFFRTQSLVTSRLVDEVRDWASKQGASE